MANRVESVGNVEEAREYLASHVPDLILLDVVLPGVDGFTFCRELKADARTRAIPVVMLTALTSQAHDRSLEAGADDFLPKSVSDPLMRIRVRLHLLLAELRRKAGGSLEGLPASVVVVAPNVTLGAQLAAQFGQDRHTTRTYTSLESLREALSAGDDLLVVDLELGLEPVKETLQILRLDPALARIPILALGTKEQVDALQEIEVMVDDVIWKPLNAGVNRHRFAFLLELARLTREFKA
jgi:two-component system cell cycle response regulator